jgi:modification methylase
MSIPKHNNDYIAKMAKIGEYELDKVYLGDCIELMKQLPENSIDLIVTSPPYNAGKEYGTYDDSQTLDQWLTLMRNFLKESYRVMSDRSRTCVNLPWVMMRKPQIFVAHKVATIGEEVGFYIRDWVIWDKGVAPSTAWGSWLSPSGPTIRCRSEPIIVFQKGIGGKKRISGEGHGKCIKGDCTSKEFQQYTENVWSMRCVRQKNHPAMFPVELPYRLIKLYTWQGDVVLDPFMGSGTTGEAAKKLGRNYLGFELSQEYVNIANKRLSQTNMADFQGLAI